MKIKLEATIPTTQYGNIRPTFEIESSEEIEEANSKLKELWNRFGESPLKDKHGGGTKVKTFTGEAVIWNEETHTYTDLQGNVLLSGSKYADQHSPKFDMDMLLPKTAKAWDVSEEELKALWKINSQVSLYWGSAIHTALEIAHKHGAMGKKIQEVKSLERSYTSPKQSHLRGIVDEFITKYGTDALSEVLISDTAHGMAGTIDRLSITGEMECRVGDYKTNAEMDAKKKLKYQKQLSFYANILINKGWKVTGLDLFYLDEDDKWVHEEMKVLDLE